MLNIFVFLIIAVIACIISFIIGRVLGHHILNTRIKNLREENENLRTNIMISSRDRD